MQPKFKLIAQVDQSPCFGVDKLSLYLCYATATYELVRETDTETNTLHFMTLQEVKDFLSHEGAELDLKGKL